jgi:hypothetical protein
MFGRRGVWTVGAPGGWRGLRAYRCRLNWREDQGRRKRFRLENGLGNRFELISDAEQKFQLSEFVSLSGLRVPSPSFLRVATSDVYHVSPRRVSGGKDHALLPQSFIFCSEATRR